MGLPDQYKRVLFVLIFTAMVAYWIQKAYSYNSGMIYVAICAVSALIYIFNDQIKFWLSVIFFGIFAALWVMVNQDLNSGLNYLVVGIGAASGIGLLFSKEGS